MAGIYTGLDQTLQVYSQIANLCQFAVGVRDDFIQFSAPAVHFRVQFLTFEDSSFQFFTVTKCFLNPLVKDRALSKYISFVFDIFFC